MAGSVVINADAQKIVLDPIERMMNLVELVAANPLKPLNLSKVRNDETKSEYETKLLESTIEKITGLLRVMLTILTLTYLTKPLTHSLTSHSLTHSL